MARKRLKPIRSIDEIPEHMTEDEAAEFYSTHSLAEIWDQLEPVEEEFRIAVSPWKRISLKLPEALIERLKTVAQAKGIPLRTLMWLWLRERLQAEEREDKTK